MLTKKRRYGLLDYGVEVDDVETDPSMGLLAPNLAAKRDWRASAYDRLMPHGDSEMEDGDKSRMFRQGLLHLGAGLLSNGGGFSNALGQGISGGLLAMNKGADDLADRQYKQMIAQQNMDGGTAFRGLDAQARAAGYEPGTEGYQNFMKRDNGEIARASSSGYTQVKFTDAQGRERVGSFNGRTGSIDLPDGTSFNPQTGQTSASPVAPTIPQNQSGQPFSIDPSLPPEVQAAIRGNERAWSEAPDMSSVQVPARQPQRMGADTFIGRPAEQQAGMTTLAQEQAKLAVMPMRNQLEAQGAGMSTAAQEAAKLDAYVQATAPTVDREAAVTTAKANATTRAEAVAGLPQALASADQTIAAIDKVLTHPGLGVGTGASARFDPRNYVGGTDAKNFNVAAAQVEGKAFLTAFESLRGGGAITEREGAAATAAIARLDRAQSASEYRAGLKELRGIAANAKMRAKARAGKKPASDIDSLLDMYK